MVDGGWWMVDGAEGACFPSPSTTHHPPSTALWVAAAGGRPARLQRERHGGARTGNGVLGVLGGVVVAVGERATGANDEQSLSHHQLIRLDETAIAERTRVVEVGAEDEILVGGDRDRPAQRGIGLAAALVADLPTGAVGGDLPLRQFLTVTHLRRELERGPA